MPWGETSVEDEKLRFIVECLQGEGSMTERCGRYGISRETGYELLRRYRAESFAGLAPRSRAPHRHGRRMAEALVTPILALRQAKPSWGPKKLKAVLERRHPELAWPAASTIGDLLRREGLAEPRRRRRTAVAVHQPFGPVAAPNDLWCIDFKGWFRTADGTRCDPLTLSDADSRFLLVCRIMPPTAAAVWPAVDRAFRDYGLPQALRSDNGPPFAAIGAGGLSRLSVHWLKLGIRLERIEPGQPQQNGRHERMHGTLTQDTTRPPAEDPAEQQGRFERYRREYNEERPHEALGQQTPASRYRASERLYPARIERPWYDAEHAERMVKSDGTIKWMNQRVFVSQALDGEPIGIAELPVGDWIVRFCGLDLGVIDRHSKQFRRFAAPRPGRGKAEQTGETVNHVSGP